MEQTGAPDALTLISRISVVRQEKDRWILSIRTLDDKFHPSSVETKVASCHMGGKAYAQETSNEILTTFLPFQFESVVPVC